MPTENKLNNMSTWVSIFPALVLLLTFFLPWVLWKDASLSGTGMPTGSFFSVAKEKFGVDNPFPSFSFAFNIFWLIPIASLTVIVFGFLNKNTLWPALVAGIFSISLVLVYFLFSKSMVDQLGVSKSVWAMTRPWLYIQVLTAVAVMLSAGEGKWWWKFGLIVATALITTVGFTIMGKQAEKKILEETFESTGNMKPDYTLTSVDLLKEFEANDTAANKKYREKLLLVSGNVSEVTMAADSTSAIKFTDGTGSYAIFTLEKDEYEKVKNIKTGDTVSLKGSCSGSLYSEILSTTQISFKRSILNKQ